MILTDITGIGAATAKKLINEFMVADVSALSQLTQEQIEEIADGLSGATVEKVTDWVAQANTMLGQTTSEESVEELTVEVVEEVVAQEETTKSKAKVDLTDFDKWWETSGESLLEKGHSRRSLLARAADALQFDRSSFLSGYDKNLTIRDNIIQILKNL